MERDPFQYWAFISYSHRDLAWARWLQRALETYRLPRRLVGRKGRDGPLPARLHPVFRDQEELSSGASLSQAIYRALEASRYLIVIASPHAAVSQWVEQEVEYFKSLGRADRILCLIVDGEPASGGGMLTGRLQCLPRPLRRHSEAAAGDEPIAADVRPGHDTRSVARTRLVAGLIGVGFDELRQRDERRQRWRSAAWAAAAALLVTGVVTFWHSQRLLREQALRQQAEAVRLQRIVEKGREEIREHRPARAAVLLAEAYRQGLDGPALRYWLGRSMEYLDARRRVIDTGAPIQLLRFGRDGDTLLTMGEDNHVQLWDTASGHRRLDIDGGAFRHACQLSPDSRLIGCIGGEDFDRLDVWDAATGERRGTLPTQSATSLGTLFGKGSHPLVTIAEDGHPELHSLEHPADTLRLPMQASTVNFNQGGDRLLIGTPEGEVSMWTLDPLRLVRRFPKLAAPVYFADATEGGGKVAASDLHGTLRIWDADGRALLSVSSPSNRVYMGFDRSGENLITESFDGVRVWGAGDGRLRFALRVSASNTTESRLSPDGEVLYSSGLSELRAYQVDSGQPTYAVDGHQQPANDMDFSPDGRRLATAATDGRVVLWELPQQPVFEFRHGPANPATFGNDRIAGGAAVYSHDGRFVATAATDGAVKLWDAASHALLRSFEAVDPVSVDVLAFSRDDRVLAAGGDSGGIYRWSVPGGEPLPTIDTQGAGPLWLAFSADDRLAAAWTGHRSGLWALGDGLSLGDWKRDYGSAQALSPDGLRMVVGTGGELALRRTADAGLLWSVRPEGEAPIAAVAFSGDGRVLVVANDAHSLMTLDAATGRILAKTKIPAGLLSYGVAANADGSLVAEADSNRSALLWWPATQRQLPLRGHSAVVNSVEFSPDQTMLLTTANDASARLWDVGSGELVEIVATHAQIFGTAPFVGAHFSPDGRRVLVATVDGVIREWPLPQETRSPAQIAARVACVAPWRLEGETLVPVLPPVDCPAAGPPAAPTSGRR